MEIAKHPVKFLLFNKKLIFEGKKKARRRMRELGAQLFQDLRAAIDDIHLTSLLLKRAVIAEPGRYIRRDPRLPELLARIRRAGKQAFLLTNSDWWYTNHVMTFLLGPDWTAAFDVVGVDANKRQTPK